MALWKTEQTDDGIVIATYHNSPMNYIGRKASDELLDLLDAWKDPTIRVIVFTGGINGKFITHFDGEELADLGNVMEIYQALNKSPIYYYNDALKLLQAMHKPIIAAINGDAMGGGFEFALACDIRIAQKGDYRIGLPETLLGLIPGGGGTQRLPRLIGMAKALDFILRGRIVKPEKALELGLVTELADNALNRAKIIARDLAALPPIGLSRAKIAVYRGLETSLDTGIEIENSVFLDTLTSGETAETVGQYLSVPLEKRRDWLDGRSHPEPPG